MYRKVSVLILTIFILLLVPFISTKPLNAAPTGNYLVMNGGTVKAQNPNLSTLNSFSFEAWINPQTVSGIKNILTIGNISNNSINYQIGINGGSISLFYRNNNTSVTSITAGSLESATWQHIKATVDSSATKLYINGAQIFSSSGAINLNQAGPDIVLGGFSSNFLGDIDEVAVNTNGNMLFNWKLDQLRGETTATDSSPSGIAGLLLGGDSKIHYFGILPTPTKYALPTLPTLRRIYFPPVFPTSPVSPKPSENPQPTYGFSGFNREDRPQLPR